jgi:hypothetical protein
MMAMDCTPTLEPVDGRRENAIEADSRPLKAGDGIRRSQLFDIKYQYGRSADGLNHMPLLFSTNELSRNIY